MSEVAADLSPDIARRAVTEAVKQSGTSFAAGMAILPKPRREGMHAIYAFCRAVDDIADGGAPVGDKIRMLDDWRAEVERIYAGRPQSKEGLALIAPVQSFDLEKSEFLLMIEGMEMDARGPIVAPPFERLLAYTRRVAGSVGMLSMPTFGAPRGKASDDFALALGDALQLTNILRDVGEDAAIGRIYLPAELLAKHGAPRDPAMIVGAPGLAGVAAELATTARARFASAKAALDILDWRTVRPALLMMGVYEAYLNKLEARGWDRIGESVSLTKLQKLAIAARYALAPPPAANAD